MNKPSFAWKVGLFVFIGLVLLAALVIEFSKGAQFWQRTNTLYLRAPDVAGLKTRADVLMSGVKVGSVAEINLAPEGKSATLVVKISTRYRIHRDARFVIQPSGLLGDQYVAILPTANKGPVLPDGAYVQAEPPFNLEDFERSAGGLIQRLDQTTESLGAMITDVHKHLLNEQTLTNFSAVASNLRLASERALAAMSDLDKMVSTNAPAVSQSGSNLLVFSDRMDRLAGNLDSLVESNRHSISAAASNLEDSTAVLKQLLTDVQAGKGLAGVVLKNEEMASNISLLVSNLTVTSSNLNRLGLWGILWAHKPPKSAPARPAGELAAPKETGFSQ
jgi:virulence factor Mce-like protein